MFAKDPSKILSAKVLHQQLKIHLVFFSTRATNFHLGSSFNSLYLLCILRQFQQPGENRTFLRSCSSGLPPIAFNSHGSGWHNNASPVNLTLKDSTIFYLIRQLYFDSIELTNTYKCANNRSASSICKQNGSQQGCAKREGYSHCFDFDREWCEGMYRRSIRPLREINLPHPYHLNDT